ncbi:hypothetical protein CEP52_006644 [Fusarium oligoseptatum]|uniref:Uncharacterized protein n=1 Tax=Fusarium oligoseptatum TaxID=2604345 RepID=A0A428TS31_9HYPO|nr:hypothetical protein CEP52_006644 [Fusarium oligoseptatum]
MATCSPTEPVPNTQALDALDVQDDDSIIRNQDEAEAILQPALSAVARHLTSQKYTYNRKSPKPIEVSRTRGIEEAPEGPAIPQSAKSFVTFYAHFFLLQFQRQG